MVGVEGHDVQHFRPATDFQCILCWTEWTTRHRAATRPFPFQVNDAIQEFRVVTATSDAQFGRNIGGVVNIVTRRGTAKFHGSAFGFFATDSVDASSPLSVYNGSGFDQAAAFAGPLNAPPATNTNDPQYSPIYQPSSYNQYVNTVELINAKYGTDLLHFAERDIWIVRLQSALRSGFDPRAAQQPHSAVVVPAIRRPGGRLVPEAPEKRLVLVRGL